jgi:hypothetical protein
MSLRKLIILSVVLTAVGLFCLAQTAAASIIWS